jgi:hypothetical protein
MIIYIFSQPAHSYEIGRDGLEYDLILADGLEKQVKMPSPVNLTISMGRVLPFCAPN